MSDKNQQIIDQFMQAWNQRNLEQIMDFFHEDAEYCNIPMGPPHIGKAAIREFIEGFLNSLEDIEFIVHHQLCDDANGVVMNERTDRINLAGKTIDLPVMGVFLLHDGLIQQWRDYFDMAPFSS